MRFVSWVRQDEEEFWPRLLKDKALEKTNVKIDWDKYVDEDEATEVQKSRFAYFLFANVCVWGESHAMRSKSYPGALPPLGLFLAAP